MLALSVVALALAPALAHEDGFADWAPDGKRIVFASTRTGTWQLWTVALDGGDPVRLTTSPANDISPTCSPDGETIVFVSDRDGNQELYAMPAKGGEALRLTDTPGPESAPDFSPDGASLAFAYAESTDPAAIGRSSRIHVSRADGSERVPLLGEVAGAQVYPKWSPDGARLAFSGTLEEGAKYAVFVVDATGGTPTPISGDGPAFNAHWFPSGDLVFVSPRDGTPRLWRVASTGEATGARVERLTSNAVGWFQPRVSPDGERILVRIGFGEEHAGIALLDAAGELERSLTP